MFVLHKSPDPSRIFAAKKHFILLAVKQTRPAGTPSMACLNGDRKVVRSAGPASTDPKVCHLYAAPTLSPLIRSERAHHATHQPSKQS